jgi:hypothetical protein
MLDMDYSSGTDKRKTKRDKKEKARYNKYKKGGRHRATGIKLRSSDKASKDKKS